MNIVLAGAGAIGSSLLELIQDDAGLDVVAIVVPEADREHARSVAARFAPRAQVRGTVPEQGVDLLVEVAGHAAIVQHVLPALRRGIPAIIVSIGALSAPGLPEQLEEAARAGHTQLQLIAGAIGGIDALAAAAVGGLDAVRYIGRKPPMAWTGTPADNTWDLGALSEATVIFEGSAREAASQYPKNANVAATVSLAALGLDRTQVRLIADPAVQANIHRVEAEGAFGQLELTLQNKTLADNPKTSALVVFSAVRALRGHVNPFII